MQKLIGYLQTLLLPLAIIGIAFYSLKSGIIENIPSAQLQLMPPILFILGMILSIGFNKSRFFFVLTGYLLVFYFRDLFTTDHLIFFLKIILLLNLFIFSSVRERGFLSFWGKLRFVFIGLQAALFYLLFEFSPQFLPDFYIYLINTHPFLSSVSLIYILIATGSIFWGGLFFLNSVPHQGTFTGIFIAGSLSFLLEDTPAQILFLGIVPLLIIFRLFIDVYRVAYLDELTGLPSRRSLKQDLLKLNGPFSIAMVDIDHFKKINDRHGHDVGDQVLKYLSSALKKAPGGGKSYRYGGEEFTIIFSGQKKEQAKKNLKTLQENIEERPFFLRGPRDKRTKSKKQKNLSRKISVTVSIGLADNEKNKKPRDVIKKADQALYRAKKNGRNRISVTR